MQMIDVLKRLAELDNKSTNDVKENKVEECGPMGDVETPKSPATINITAADGAELGNMLNAIMQLAGVHKVGDEHMGVEPPASVLTAEPTMSTGPHAADNMRSVLDRMNDIGDEEADESMGHEHGIPGIDNTPADPHTQLPFEPNEFAQNTNDGDGNDENGHPRLTTQPTATFESLMAEYQDFLKEGSYGGDAYDRDYASSIAGMDGSDKRDFKRREMEHELGHETNNYAVAINGKTWKVFASKSHAESVANKMMMRDPSKKVSVHETGAEVSEDMVPTVDRGEYDREGDKVRDKYNKYDEAAYFDPVRGLRDGGTDRLANRQAAASAGELGQDELKKRMQSKANMSLRKTAPSMGKLGSKLPGAANPAYRGPANPYA